MFLSEILKPQEILGHMNVRTQTVKTVNRCVNVSQRLEPHKVRSEEKGRKLVFFINLWSKMRFNANLVK